VEETAAGHPADEAQSGGWIGSVLGTLTNRIAGQIVTDIGNSIGGSMGGSIDRRLFGARSAAFCGSGSASRMR